ncbi:MAG: hypothetical protein E7644_02725 [Ruminococcaceae bacterium]|nr:hypothetical protein [Oscillospiraceae bacterium]
MKIVALKLVSLLLLLCMLLPLTIACKPASSGVAIGDNGNWFIDGVDSGIPAKGADGTKITVGDNGNWFLDGVDTGIASAGKVGAPGADGTKITIGTNGNWFLDGIDTGISASATASTVVTIGPNGNWFLDGVDSGTSATGPAGPAGPQGPAGADGSAGALGTKITIGENGNWFLDGVDSGISAKGENGAPGADSTKVTIGANGNWFLDGVDSGVPAKGQNGTPGAPGKDGKDGTKITIGANGNWFLDGVDSGVSATGSLPPAAPGGDSTTFTPVLRFLVTSDLHLRTTSNDYQSYDILQKLYSTAYAYSEAQSYNKLDGIFFAGDFTQNGSTEEMTKFFDFVKNNTKAGTTVRAILGNHEYWESGAKYRAEEGTRYGPKSIAETYEKLMTLGGYSSVDTHITIGGFHFIILNMDRYNDDYTGSKFSPEKLAWLDAELAKADAADPTGTKPIFIFQHMPATATVNKAAQSASDDYLEAIFEKYPQAVDFSGHTHRPITDPRSIWQGGYTAINTASLAYLGTYINNHPTYDTKAVVATNNAGSWAYGDIETGVRNAVLYYFVEVNAANEVRLVVYNLASESVLMTINIGAVGDTDTYRFTEQRRYGSETPYFPAGSKLQLTGQSRSSLSMMIPQAICSETVNNYRCEVYQGTKLVTTVYRLACQYLGSEAPDQISLPISGLEPGTTYTVKVIPVSTWGKEGTPLTMTASTTSPTEMLTPDIFSLKINADGTAVNALTGAALATTGTPTVKQDATVGGYVGVFDGSSAWRFEDMGLHYEKMESDFSFETYAYVSFIPSGSYVDIASNQESGGFGFELKSSGIVYFYCNDGSGYVRPGVTLPAGEWVHLVGVLSGNTVKIYMNGVLKDTQTASGSFKPPAAGAQYLCIGGDSDSGTGGAFMTGMIASVNLYSEPLSAAEILALYEKY